MIHYFKLITGDIVVGELDDNFADTGAYRIESPKRLVQTFMQNMMMLSLGRIIPYTNLEELILLEEHVLYHAPIGKPLEVWYEKVLERYYSEIKEIDEQAIKAFREMSFDAEDDEVDEYGYNISDHESMKEFLTSLPKPTSNNNIN